jgi:hypothetical protein
MLRVLVEAGVDFVVIGGVAAGLRGSALLTDDLDICYARERENLERLAGALRSLGARLRGPDLPDDLPFDPDARALALGDTFTLRTRLGDLDILATPSGTMGFPDLDQAATTFRIAEGLQVRVCSLDDLIRMKRAARRTKDLIQLEDLAALRERIELMRAAGEDPQQGSSGC